METLNEQEYQTLFDLIKDSLYIVRWRYPNSKFSKTQAHRMALQRSQRILSVGDRWNSKLYKMVRDTKRAMNNPTLSNLYGVEIVNNMIDMIDNISGNKTPELEENILDLKDSVFNMNKLAKEAEQVTKRCDVVSGNLNKIRQFIEGETNDMPVENISNS